MTSYLLDKLEELKFNEKEIRKKKLILENKIELEMEKQRRLAMNGTIIKLQTQNEE